MYNKTKLNYWLSTGLLCLFLMASSGVYFFKNELVSETFVILGYPSYLIYPLAIAKILAVIAILSRKSVLLKELAYAGLFFDFILAFFAHLMIGDGEYPPSIVALIFLLVSYTYDKKMFAKNAEE